MIRPTNYEDESKITKLADATIGQPFLAEVNCIGQKVAGRWPRRILECLVEDATSLLTIRFMNFNEGTRKATAEGKHFRVFGQLEPLASSKDMFGTKLVMIHPRLRSAELDLPKHLTARYPRIGNIAEATLIRLVRRAIDKTSTADEAVPADLRTTTKTIPLAESLRLLHKPKPNEIQTVEEVAIRSLKFDEWLAHILFQRRQHVKLQRRIAPAIKSDQDDINTFAKHLPFVLTKSQQSAMAEIAATINQPHAMRRLLHGDVGSGKTLVAAYACWLTARAGLRSAIMCPTVILASQHYTRLTPLLEKLGVKCVMLIGSIRGKERRLALEIIATHPNTVVIGTHALVQEKTPIPDLALAVIDEQHRFGVNQRKALERKGTGAHVLMMSATPIPRTLELGMMSHLDITRITERPNRGMIRTLVFSAKRVNEVLDEIIKDDLQAYWICPLIKASATLNLRAAENEFERIRALAPGLNAGLIHGKLNIASKLEAMRKFETGQLRLLVATTVVEVGVDAPEADVIVIDHAERLGLSQLHQLRGRVGRGKKTGFCALLYEEDLSQTAKERLQTMRESNDGFEIARQDLLQRGPGDIIGKRQSGMPKYRFADYGDDPEMLTSARDIAQRMIEDHPDAANKHVRLWLGDRRALSGRATTQESRSPD